MSLNFADDFKNLLLSFWRIFTFFERGNFLIGDGNILRPHTHWNLHITYLVCDLNEVRLFIAHHGCVRTRPGGRMPQVDVHLRLEVCQSHRSLSPGLVPWLSFTQVSTPEDFFDEFLYVVFFLRDF